MLPSHSGRSWKRGAAAVVFLLVSFGLAAAGAEPTKDPATPGGKARPTPIPVGVPLPVGHEVKGLVLPDYNADGQLQARFEAAVAKRVDAERVEFTGLKVTTYTPENKVDLMIDLPSSILDLNTRVVTSHERTTISRTDFKIAGDSLRFDTAARHGTLQGNVKMVITDSARLVQKSGE